MTCEVRVENAVLRYIVGRAQRGSIKEAILGGRYGKVRMDERLSQDGQVTALNGISFTIADGQRMAILGVNGAGKTTLLKAIAGVYPLVAGRITVRGHIQSLLDISLGFEADATGRENITYRGLIMGVHPKAIREREEEIIAFADIGEFIEMPLRSYSSGMMVRLAFAISTYLQGEILLLDEFLGAGDATFQAKAADRMNAVVDSARIVVLATHSTALARKVCSIGILLDKGRIIADGPVDDVCKRYEALTGNSS